MKRALLALLLASGAAQAQTTIGLHLASHHFEQRDYQRNFNPGIYVRTEDGWTAGVYRNTLGRTSVYGGYTIGDQVALTVGVVSGYQIRHEWAPPLPGGQCSNGPPPCYRELGTSHHALNLMVAPSVRLGPARVSFIPGLGNASSVLHLSIERRF